MKAFVAVDRYFEVVIPPILVREIGGDLASTSRTAKERNQSVLVEKLAHRPGVRAFLAPHGPLIWRNLIGFPVPMDGRVPSMMEQTRMPDGTLGLRVSETPEEIALNRWRQRDFSTVDYLWAQDWQRVKRFVPRALYARVLERHGVIIDRHTTLHALGQRIDEVMQNPNVQPGLLRLIFSEFAVPMTHQEDACKRFQSKQPRQLIDEFAPYAAFCLKANFILAFGRMSRQEETHDLRDIEYCYYLPFCEVFASDDNLHREVVPLLARPNQMFVGSQLGADLQRLTAEWEELTEDQQIEFSRVHRNRPLEHEGSIVREIWQRFRGPNAPNDRPVDQEPDEYFRKLIRKHYGDEKILEETDIDKVGYVVQTTQISKERLRQLYPGVNIEEQ